MRDRLLLDPARVTEMARGMREVANLPDPVDQTVWRSGLVPMDCGFAKCACPGVVGIIYESRPNVTADTVALTFKTGNAIVLRGGKEAARSNQRLVEILAASLACRRAPSSCSIRARAIRCAS